MTIFFSWYEGEEDSIIVRNFVSKELALGAMKREARRIYKSSAIIQGSRSRYYDEYLTEIHFGESPDKINYRREYGFCKVELIELEDEESGDEVPSSSDDESEDDY